ncbi:uncharacterized protein LAESUDRAFT_248919 [Laetiporus sulphureus 93-53]|uniref:Uncharacterized protein n=1 Tax=Laetiporus sulphureus 93-53 TaxID=1314785 RepID=A0A165DIM9_9APHY|nr:uncharacterized protein LAESUDRAFT_248919 [Laetiporus sulphureus 93-53]KZT04965.1 hypothetical protein LAESUDRAFT_248919 [Laetiporus sulphureus 93-53]
MSFPRICWMSTSVCTFPVVAISSVRDRTFCPHYGTGRRLSGIMAIVPYGESFIDALTSGLFDLGKATTFDGPPPSTLATCNAGRAVPAGRLCDVYVHGSTSVAALEFILRVNQLLDHHSGFPPRHGRANPTQNVGQFAVSETRRAIVSSRCESDSLHVPELPVSRRYALPAAPIVTLQRRR